MTREQLDWGARFVAAACVLCACESRPNFGPDTLQGMDAGACADRDGDGFGDGCARGRDCDDGNPAVTNQCLRCLEPDLGCACAQGAEPVACFLEPSEMGGGQLMCHEGTRTCRNGTWGGCESIHSYVMDRRAATRLVPDASHPNCTPCDVLCFRIDDNLDPVDGGLTDANSGGVTWAPGGGLILQSSLVGADAGSGIDAAVDSDAAVPVCQLGVPPDADCDGIPDTVDPFPGSPPFVTEYQAIYHALAPGQTGNSSLDLTFNLNNADVYFLIDQSGSMGEERGRLVADLRTGTFLDPSVDCADTDFDGLPNNELKSQGIIGSIRCLIRDAWFGAGYFVEYPLGSHGHSYANGHSDDETVYRNLQTISQDISLVDSALSSMYTNGNIDWPESDVPALWSVATGQGMYLGHNRMGVPPQLFCPAGTHGYPCFRDTAIPIVVLFTDASFHNGPAPTPNAYAASYAIASGTQTTITPVPSTNESFETAFDVGDVTNSLVTLAGTTAGAAADIPGWMMGCGATDSERDVVFKFDVSQQRAITIKTDGTVQDTLISLFSGVPRTGPTTTTAIAGESYSLGDVYDEWVELTGTTSGNADDYQGGVVGCSAGAAGKDTVVSFTPSQNMNVAVGSSMLDRVAWFRMGDGDTYPTVTDVTGGHDGVMTNMTSGDLVLDAPPSGSFANTRSVDFDGTNDVIAVANDAELDITDALTVSVWVKGGSQDNTVISKYNTSGRRSWRIAANASRARINVSNTGGPYNASNMKAWNTSFTPFDGAWHHIAFTYEAGMPDGTLKVFVDGVEDTAITRTWNPNVPSLYSTTANVVIGGYNPEEDEFSGRIDEVGIWHAALTPSQVAAVYNAGSPSDLNTVGGTIVGVYSALPPTKPSVTAVANTNDSVATARNATNNLVGSYLSFSGDTAAVEITPSLDAVSAGCGAATASNDVLYQFQLAQDRRVRIDTEGSAFDTVISLYDVAPASVEPGTGTNTNEAVATAQSIGAMAGKRYLYTGDTGGMTPDYDGSFVGCGAASGANDAVYSFTLATPRTVRINTSATTAFDPVVSLHGAVPSPTVTASTNTNDTLLTAQGIGAVDGLRRIYTGGDTSSLAADYTGAIVGCGSTDGARDAVVDFTLSSAATVEIDTQGSGFDTVIGLFDDLTPADSLVSWWRMGDGDTYSTIVDGVSAFNGTMNSMASNDFELVVPPQDHPNTYSTNFDGSDDYVSVNDTAALRFTTAMTFSGWVKGASQSNTIAAKYQTSSDQRSWRVYGNGSGGISVGISRDGTWSSTTAKAYATTSGTALDGNWHHVAFTFGSSTLKIYIDGVERPVTAAYDGTVASIYQGASDVTLGAHLSGGSSSRFAGNIDEVTLWNTALTTAQIAQLYNAGAPTNPTVLGTFPTTRPSPASVASPSIGIDFDGSNDFASVATDAGLNITNNLTVSMWANVGTGNKTLASRYRTSGNRRAWRLSSDGAKLRVIVSSGGNYNSSTTKDYSTTADVFGAGWVHVGFTFASNVLTLYVNGVAQAVTQTHNATVNTLYSTTTPATVIGGYENTGSGGVTEEPDGVIDEVSIWNVARSGAQMAAMYNAGVPTDLTGSTGLVAWWRMGEGSTHPTLNDAVGTRHMTMANMASDDFVAGVPGNVFYANEAKATAYDVGTVNGRWKVFSGNTNAMASDGPTFGCGSNASAPDAYFQFTLANPTSVIVDSIGSAFDTSIGVFPAATTTFNAASLIACDDNSGGSSTSSLTTGTLAAGTYYVVVKGTGPATAGAYELSVRDAAGAGMASNTLGTRLACNDDDGTENTSRIVASLPAGTYHVVVKSTGASGAYTLRVSDQSASSGAIACANPAAAASGTPPDNNCTYRTYGTHGYWFCTDNRNWNTARANCLAVGYDLISIDDAGEQAWANTHRNGETHIGYTDSAVEGTFVWSNGSSSTYTAWGSGQPNNSAGGQDCSEFYYSDGTWNDNDCTNENQDYICESAPLYDSEIVESLAAGTYYVVVKGAAAGAEGAYSMLIEDTGASGAPFMCNDDGAIDGSSAIEANLLAGTYYVAVKGKSAGAKDAYQLTLRDATDVPSNVIGCGNDSVTTSLTAGQTYYAVVKGDAIAGDGPFGLTFQDVDNAGGVLLSCDDDSGPGSQSLLTRTLDPGTYYLAMKKANHAQGQGNYQISFGGAASVAGTFAPPTWNETISALNAADIRVMTVYSTGGSDTTLLQSHATALANATDAVGQNGSPLVSSMSADGSGLSAALVNQIQELAQYLSMDVGLRVSYDPDTPPAPGFLFNFVPVNESPGNGCSGVAGIEHLDCLPGATPRFTVSITNPLGTPVPPNPAPGSNGGYNFRLQLIADDRYVVDEIPVFIVPLEVMVVPPTIIYEPEGVYWQDVASTSCNGAERPSWRDLLFNVTVPDGTDVEFDACGGDNQAQLDACTLLPVVTVAGSGTCTLDSDCTMGATCAANGVCQLITAGVCTTDANCSSTSSCINNLCTYAASPANLLHAIGPSNNYRNLLRLKITMHASPDRTASPQLDQWQIRYECAQIQ